MKSKHYLNINIRLKYIAITIVVAFLSQEISQVYAFVPSVASQLPLSSANKAVLLQQLIHDPSKIIFPTEHSNLKEIYKAASPKLVILIEDAHANYSAQMHLASTMQSLMEQYGIELTLSEGGQGDSTLSDVRTKLSKQDLVMGAKALLFDGQIAGHEYLNLTSELPLRITGIEDMDLYEKNLIAFDALKTERKKIIDYLRHIKKSIQSLKNKRYPKALLEYENKMRHEKNEDAQTLHHFRELLDLAKQNQISITAYASTNQYLILQQLERLIPFDRLNQELGTFLTSDETLQQGFLEAYKNESPFQQLQLLEQAVHNKPQMSRFSHYPTLKQYMEYLREFKKINFASLIEEFEQLEREVYVTLLKEESLKNIYEIDRYVELLEDAYSIQLNANQFEWFKENRDLFTTIAWQAFLNQQLAESERYSDLIHFKQLIEESQDKIDSFYEYVGKRDTAFIANIENSLEGEKLQSAFVISGGYHTQHLTELLKEKNISYVVLTPRVDSETDYEKYETRLLASLDKQRRYTLSQILAGQPKAAARLSEFIQKNPDRVASRLASEIMRLSGSSRDGARLADISFGEDNSPEKPETILKFAPEPNELEQISSRALMEALSILEIAVEVSDKKPSSLFDATASLMISTVLGGIIEVIGVGGAASSIVAMILSHWLTLSTPFSNSSLKRLNQRLLHMNQRIRKQAKYDFMYVMNSALKHHDYRVRAVAYQIFKSLAEAFPESSFDRTFKLNQYLLTEGIRGKEAWIDPKEAYREEVFGGKSEPLRYVQVTETYDPYAFNWKSIETGARLSEDFENAVKLGLLKKIEQLENEYQSSMTRWKNRISTVFGWRGQTLRAQIQKSKALLKKIQSVQDQRQITEGSIRMVQLNQQIILPNEIKARTRGQGRSVERIRRLVDIAEIQKYPPAVIMLNEASERIPGPYEPKENRYSTAEEVVESIYEKAGLQYQKLSFMPDSLGSSGGQVDYGSALLIHPEWKILAQSEFKVINSGHLLMAKIKNGSQETYVATTRLAPLPDQVELRAKQIDKIQELIQKFVVESQDEARAGTIDWNDIPIIFMGDMNFSSESEIASSDANLNQQQRFNFKDGFRALYGDALEGITFAKGKNPRVEYPSKRLDIAYLHGTARIQDFRILDEPYSHTLAGTPKFASDHFPIDIRFSLSDQQTNLTDASQGEGSSPTSTAVKILPVSELKQLIQTDEDKKLLEEYTTILEAAGEIEVENIQTTPGARLAVRMPDEIEVREMIRAQYQKIMREAKDSSLYMGKSRERYAQFFSFPEIPQVLEEALVQRYQAGLLFTFDYGADGKMIGRFESQVYVFLTGIGMGGVLIDAFVEQPLMATDIRGSDIQAFKKGDFSVFGPELAVKEWQAFDQDGTHTQSLKPRENKIRQLLSYVWEDAQSAGLDAPLFVVGSTVSSTSLPNDVDIFRLLDITSEQRRAYDNFSDIFRKSAKDRPSVIGNLNHVGAVIGHLIFAIGSTVRQYEQAYMVFDGKVYQIQLADHLTGTRPEDTSGARLADETSHSQMVDLGARLSDANENQQPLKYRTDPAQLALDVQQFVDRQILPGLARYSFYRENPEQFREVITRKLTENALSNSFPGRDVAFDDDDANQKNLMIELFKRRIEQKRHLLTSDEGSIDLALIELGLGSAPSELSTILKMIKQAAEEIQFPLINLSLTIVGIDGDSIHARTAATYLDINSYQWNQDGEAYSAIPVVYEINALDQTGLIKARNDVILSGRKFDFIFARNIGPSYVNSRTTGGGFDFNQFETMTAEQAAEELSASITSWSIVTNIAYTFADADYTYLITEPGDQFGDPRTSDAIHPQFSPPGFEPLTFNRLKPNGVNSLREGSKGNAYSGINLFNGIHSHRRTLVQFIDHIYGVEDSEEDTEIFPRDLGSRLSEVTNFAALDEIKKSPRVTQSTVPADVLLRGSEPISSVTSSTPSVIPSTPSVTSSTPSVTSSAPSVILSDSEGSGVEAFASREADPSLPLRMTGGIDRMTGERVGEKSTQGLASTGWGQSPILQSQNQEQSPSIQASDSNTPVTSSAPSVTSSAPSVILSDSEGSGVEAFAGIESDPSLSLRMTGGKDRMTEEKDRMTDERDRKSEGKGRRSISQVAGRLSGEVTFGKVFSTHAEESLKFILRTKDAVNVDRISAFKRIDQKVSERDYKFGPAYRLTERYTFSYEEKQYTFELTYYDAYDLAYKDVIKESISREIYISTFASAIGIAPEVHMIDEPDGVMLLTRFVEGISADQLRFDLQDISEVAEVLGRLHSTGIVHNDLVELDYSQFRSGNLLADEADGVRVWFVVDFEYAELEQDGNTKRTTEAQNVLNAINQRLNNSSDRTHIEEAFRTGYQRGLKSGARLAFKDTPFIGVTPIIDEPTREIVDRLWSKVFQADSQTSELDDLASFGFDVYVGGKIELSQGMTEHGKSHEWKKSINTEDDFSLQNAIQNAVDNLRQHRGNAELGLEKGIILKRIIQKGKEYFLQFIYLDNGPGFVNKDTGVRIPLSIAMIQGVPGESLGGKGTGHFGVGTTVIVKEADNVTFREVHFNQERQLKEVFEWKKRTSQDGKVSIFPDTAISRDSIPSGVQIIWEKKTTVKDSNFLPIPNTKGTIEIGKPRLEPLTGGAVEENLMFENSAQRRNRHRRYVDALEKSGLNQELAEIVSLEIESSYANSFAWPVGIEDVDIFMNEFIAEQLKSNFISEIKALHFEEVISFIEERVENVLYGNLGARLTDGFDWEVENVASTYATFALNAFYQQVNQELVRMANPDESETWLDLGSGTGSGTVLVAQKVGSNGKVIGIDGSEQMTAWANARPGLSNAEFRNGYAENMAKLVPEAADGIIAFNSIHLMSDIDAVLDASAEKLPEGGTLAFSTNFYSDPLTRSNDSNGIALVMSIVQKFNHYAESRNEKPIKKRIKLKTPEQYAQELEAHGFEIIESKRMKMDIPIGALKEFYRVPGMSATLVPYETDDETARQIVLSALDELESTGVKTVAREWLLVAAKRKPKGARLADEFNRENSVSLVTSNTPPVILSTPPVILSDSEGSGVEAFAGIESDPSLSLRMTEEKDRMTGGIDRMTEEKDRMTGEGDEMAGEKDRVAGERVGEKLTQGLASTGWGQSPILQSQNQGQSPSIQAFDSNTPVIQSTPTTVILSTPPVILSDSEGSGFEVFAGIESDPSLPLRMTGERDGMTGERDGMTGEKGRTKNRYSQILELELGSRLSTEQIPTGELVKTLDLEGARLSNHENIKESHLPYGLPEKYFVLVPAFNEADDLPQVIKNIRSKGYLHRVIFVDDASTDETLSVLKENNAAYMSLQSNRQKEGGLVDVLEQLEIDYQNSSQSMPQTFIAVDGDTYLTAGKKDVEAELLRIVQKFEEKNIHASPVVIEGNITSKSSFLEYLQAMEWKLTSSKTIPSMLGITPDIPGGGTVYNTKAFKESVNNVDADFHSRPIKMKKYMIQQGYKIRLIPSSLRARTDIAKNMNQYTKERQKWLIGVFRGSPVLGIFVYVVSPMFFISYGIYTALTLPDLMIQTALVISSTVALWGIKNHIQSDQNEVSITPVDFMLLIGAAVAWFALAPALITSQYIAGKIISYLRPTGSRLADESKKTESNIASVRQHSSQSDIGSPASSRLSEQVFQEYIENQRAQLTRYIESMGEYLSDGLLPVPEARIVDHPSDESVYRYFSEENVMEYNRSAVQNQTEFNAEALWIQSYLIEWYQSRLLNFTDQHFVDFPEVYADENFSERLQDQMWPYNMYGPDWFDISMYAGKDVLVTGSGDGSFEHYLMAASEADGFEPPRITGVDGSNAFIELSQRRADQAGHEISYFQSQFSDLSELEDNSYDYIYIAHTLYVLPPDLRKIAVMNLYQKLRPGGQIIIFELLAQLINVPISSENPWHDFISPEWIDGSEVVGSYIGAPSYEGGFNPVAIVVSIQKESGARLAGQGKKLIGNFKEEYEDFLQAAETLLSQYTNGYDHNQSHPDGEELRAKYQRMVRKFRAFSHTWQLLGNEKLSHELYERSRDIVRIMQESEEGVFPIVLQYELILADLLRGEWEDFNEDLNAYFTGKNLPVYRELSEDTKPIQVTLMKQHANDRLGQFEQEIQRILNRHRRAAVRNKKALKKIQDIQMTVDHWFDLFREYPLDYPIASYVPEDKRPIQVEYLEYSPVYYTDPKVLNSGEAHAEDPEFIPTDLWTMEDTILYDGLYPQNPVERTGITGRGRWWYWGPNWMTDIIITRINPKTKELEMLAIKRRDTGQWAIPGGTHSENRDFKEDMAEALRNKLGIKVDTSNAQEVSKGYVHDPRNTDNAWAESYVGHIHIGPKHALNRADFKLERFVLEAKWLPLTAINVAGLYGDHPKIVQTLLDNNKHFLKGARLAETLIVGMPDAAKNINADELNSENPELDIVRRIARNQESPKNTPLAIPIADQAFLMNIDSSQSVSLSTVSGTSVHVVEFPEVILPLRSLEADNADVSKIVLALSSQESIEFANDLSGNERSYLNILMKLLQQTKLDDVVWVLEEKSELYSEALSGVRALVESERVGGKLFVLTRDELKMQLDTFRTSGRFVTYLIPESFDTHFFEELDLTDKASAWVYPKVNETENLGWDMPAIRLNALIALTIQASDKIGKQGELLAQAASRLAGITGTSIGDAQAHLVDSRDVRKIQMTYIAKSKPFLITIKVLTHQLAQWIQTRAQTAWSA